MCNYLFCGVADNLLSGITTLRERPVHGCNIVRLDFYMIDPLSTSSSLCSEEKKKHHCVCILLLPEYLHACLFGMSVFIKTACCSRSLLYFWSSVLVSFLPACLWWEFSPTCCLVCLVLSGRLADVFLLICCGGL